MAELREIKKKKPTISILPENLGACISYLGTLSMIGFWFFFFNSGKFLAFPLIAFRNIVAFLHDKWTLFIWWSTFSKWRLLDIVFEKEYCVYIVILWAFGSNPRLFFTVNEEILYQNWRDIYHGVIDVPVSWKQRLKLKLYMSHKESILREWFLYKRWLFFVRSRDRHNLFLVK